MACNCDDICDCPGYVQMTDSPCAAPDVCGAFCIGLCQNTDEVVPQCDLENVEICESCT